MRIENLSQQHVEAFQPQRGCVRRLTKGRNPFELGMRFLMNLFYGGGLLQRILCSSIDGLGGKMPPPQKNEAGPKSDLIRRETNLS
jgi:hypothetical protein